MRLYELIFIWLFVVWVCWNIHILSQRIDDLYSKARDKDKEVK